MLASWLPNIRSIWILHRKGIQECVRAIRIEINILSAIPKWNGGLRLVGDIVLNASILAPLLIATLGSDTDELIKEHFTSILNEERAIVIAEILVDAFGYVFGFAAAHRFGITTTFHRIIFWIFRASVVIANAARAIATGLFEVAGSGFFLVILRGAQAWEGQPDRVLVEKVTHVLGLASDVPPSILILLQASADASVRALCFIVLVKPSELAPPFFIGSHGSFLLDVITPDAVNSIFALTAVNFPVIRVFKTRCTAIDADNFLVDIPHDTAS